MEVQVNTIQVRWDSLKAGDWVVVGRKVRKVVGVNTQRRSVQVSLGDSGTDSFPHDWWNYGGHWDMVTD